MANVDLSKYDTVKSRKLAFYEKFPEGRISPRILNDDVDKKAFFICKVYKNPEEQEKGLPLATGFAFEFRDLELKTSNSGKKYESVNYSSWIENCEESAIGRALDNAGFSPNKTCSREEMQKSQRMNNTIKNGNEAASDKQKYALKTMLAKKYGGDFKIPPELIEALDKLSKKGASKKIEELKKELDEK